MLGSLSPPARALFMASRRFSRLQMPRPRVFAGVELRPNEFFLLLTLHRAGEEGGLRASDLASMLGVTAGNVTQLVAGLEERGLVRRETDPGDRRVVRVRIAEGGFAVMGAAREAFEGVYADLVGELGAEDCERLVALLDRASDSLERRLGVEAPHAGTFCPGILPGR